MKKVYIDNIKDYIIIDDEDYNSVNKYKWHINDYYGTTRALAFINGKKVALPYFITGVVNAYQKNKNLDFRKQNIELIMTKNYSYIPNKENLFILLKSEYEDIIRQLKQNKEVHSFDRIIKGALDGVCLNLFLDNHYCKSEDICSEAGEKEYKEVKEIICERLGIDSKLISSSVMRFSIFLKKEFQKIINTVNKSIIPQKVINTFELLMLKTVFIKLEYIQSKKCSYLYFLDDDLEIISKNTIPTSYAKHITDIYNNKDWL